MTEEKKLLIVEDNEEQIKYAQEEAAKYGITDIQVASNLTEAIRAMSGCNLILSDLFFPVGDMFAASYIERFLPYYEKYKEKRFSKIEKSPVAQALQKCAEVFGVKPEYYVENVVAKLDTDTPKLVLREARNVVKELKDYENYKKTLDKVKNGTNLPLGIIVIEQAQKWGLPSAIVTSTYHHDHAFEAIRELVTVPYCDILVNNKKDWKNGLYHLMNEL